MKLKKCPFCGGDAELTISGNPNYGCYIIVKCTTCGAAAKGRFYQGEPIEIPLKKTNGGIYAMNAWNRRVGDENEIS